MSGAPWWRVLGALAALSVLLPGCASPPPVPNDKFYRLVAEEAAGGAAPPLSGDLLVRPLRSDGALNGRAILFTTDGGERMVEQYAYHYWIDSPSRLLQDYLVAALQARAVATRISGDSGTGPPRYTLSGRILRLEHLRLSAGAGVVVALELQLREGPRALLNRVYLARAEASSAAVADAIPAFEAALGELVGRFARDLAEIGS